MKREEYDKLRQKLLAFAIELDIDYILKLSIDPSSDGYLQKQLEALQTLSMVTYNYVSD